MNDNERWKLFIKNEHKRIVDKYNAKIAPEIKYLTLF